MTSCLASYSLFILALSLAVSVSAGPNIDYETISELIDLFTRQTICCATLVNLWRQIDHILYDIPFEEESRPRLFTRRKHLRIDDLFIVHPDLLSR